MSLRDLAISIYEDYQVRYSNSNQFWEQLENNPTIKYLN